MPGFGKDTSSIPILNVKEMKKSNASIARVENASKLGMHVQTGKQTQKVAALNSHILDQVALETEIKTYTDVNDTNVVKMPSENFVREHGAVSFFS
jgi:hypothetical protein